MVSRFRFAVLVAAAFALACSLAACAGSPASSAASSSSSAASSAASSAESSSAAASSSSNAAPDAKSQVTIGLDYNAGTGYEWTYAADPEGVVELTDQVTEDLSQQKDIAGGPLRENFTFKALKPGEVVLTFTLARSWEQGAPAETQTYAFTVSDDLKFVLNPYKSDFVNEPE